MAKILGNFHVALVIGIIVWDEVPNLLAVLGIVIVIAPGLAMLARMLDWSSARMRSISERQASGYFIRIEK